MMFHHRLALTLSLIMTALTWAQPPAESEVLVSVQKPILRDILLTTICPAELQPLRSAVLSAEWSGPVTSMPVEAFDQVEKGELLCELDTSMLDLQIREAEARYTQAKAEWKRAQGLIEKKAITQIQFLERETQYLVAEAGLELLRVQREKAQVRAPWPGSISEKHIEVGDYVVPGQPVVSLVDTGSVRVRAVVPSSYAPMMRPGLKAVLKIQNTLKSFPGTLDRVAPELEPDSRTLQVEMVLPDGEAGMKPGAVANVEITVGDLKQAMCIPMVAVLEFENTRGVYVFDQGVAKRKIVELGSVDGDMVVVTSGLELDDQVIIQGQQWLSQGQKVQLAQENQR